MGDEVLSLGTLLRHGAGILVGALLAGLLIGLAVAAQNDPGVRSTAEVKVIPLVREVLAAGSRPSQLIDPDTEGALVRSDLVVAGVSATTGQAANGLRAGLEISAVPNSQILQISWHGDDALESQQVTQAFAEVYLSARRADAETLRSRELESLAHQVSELDVNINALADEVAASRDGSAERRATEARLASSTQQLTQLENQRAELERLDLHPGEVVRMARPGTATGVPEPAIVIGSMGVGALLGVGAAVLRTRRALGINHP